MERTTRRRGTGLAATGVAGLTAGLGAWLSVAALAVVAGSCARWRAGTATGRDRGDVPGWVLVTLMTAGLVVGLWAVAGPRLETMFTESMDRVLVRS